MLYDPNRPRRLPRLLIALIVAPLSLVVSAMIATAELVDDTEAASSSALKNAPGHYVHIPRHPDDLERAELACSNPQVKGVRYTVWWNDVENIKGDYDFQKFEDVIDRISETDADRPGNKCRVFFTVHWVAFNDDQDPCPAYVSDQDYVSPRPAGGNICHMWEGEVRFAYKQMIQALAAQFDSHWRVMGMRFPETSTGLRNNHPDNYSAQKYADALTTFYTECSDKFSNSWCITSFNWLPKGDGGRRQDLLRDIMIDMQDQSNGNVCIGANDVAPSKKRLYNTADAPYQIAVDYPGCRVGNITTASYRECPINFRGEECEPINDPYPVTEGTTLCAGKTDTGEDGCSMNDLFRFSVRGTVATFDDELPYDSGLCADPFLFWQYHSSTPRSGTFQHALAAMDNHPYGTDWTNRCNNPETPSD